MDSAPLPPVSQDRTQPRDALIVLALFAGSTLLYAWLGVRFDTHLLLTGLQFIDVDLLMTRLLESLWYYHAQPPLLNLFAGIGLKLFGPMPTAYFSIAFHTLGLATAFCVFSLTRKLTASRIAATITTALLLFSPSFVLYENWLLYSFPAMALITMATLTLHKYLETRTTAWCAMFFALLAVLVLTRSLFHLAWMVLVAVVLAALVWEKRIQVLISAALPLLVVAGWYGKNYLMVGAFSASTMMGLGFSNVTVMMVPVNDLVPLVKKGELSVWSLVSRYEDAPAMFRAGLTPPTGIPVLDNITKSNNWFNYNFRDLPVVSAHHAHDSLVVIRKFPERYLSGLAISNRLYFSPTSMNMYFIDSNRLAAAPMDAIFNPLLYGARARPGLLSQPHFGETGVYKIEVNFSPALVIEWFAVIAFGLVTFWKVIRRGSEESAERRRAIVMGFIAGTAIYLYFVSTLIELAENYRYRFVIEPLMFVMAATAVTEVVRWGRSARQRKAGA